MGGAKIASRAASRPSDHCTALTATNAQDPSIASATRVSGTSRTSTPGCARNGHSTDVKSSSAHTTRAPGASDKATNAAKADDWEPTATSSSPTPTSRAKLARAAPTDSSQPQNPVRPWRHSSHAAMNAE
jgi:hypothetical protein